LFYRIFIVALLSFNIFLVPLTGIIFRAKNFCPALKGRAGQGVRASEQPCPEGQGRAGRQGIRAALPCDGLWKGLRDIKEKAESSK